MKKQGRFRAETYDYARRCLAFGFAGCALIGAKANPLAGPIAAASAPETRSDMSKDEWLDQYFAQKAFGPPLAVARFLDRTYYLIRDLWWGASGSSAPLGKITVPTGFVTDFASIPRVFWSVLPPDDEYVVAAVIHDWLYWNQATTRETADRALMDAMVELGVSTATVWTIYNGVSLFGSSAWDKNRELKAKGERRVLKDFPADLKATWTDWKLRPGAFQ